MSKLPMKALNYAYSGATLSWCILAERKGVSTYV